MQGYLYWVLALAAIVLAAGAAVLLVLILSSFLSPVFPRQKLSQLIPLGAIPVCIGLYLSFLAPYGSHSIVIADNKSDFLAQLSDLETERAMEIEEDQLLTSDMRGNFFRPILPRITKIPESMLIRDSASNSHRYIYSLASYHLVPNLLLVESGGIVLTMIACSYLAGRFTQTRRIANTE